MSTSHHLRTPIRHRLEMAGEFIFLVDAILVSMIGLVLVIGGINPFDSPLLTGLLIATALIMVGHHVWYARNRNVIDHDPVRQRARERRGF